MNKKTVTWLAMVVLVFASSVYAQPVDDKWSESRAHRQEKIDNVVKELGLTEEQQQQLKDTRKEYHEQM